MSLKQQFGTWYEPLKEFLESKDFLTISKQIRNDRYKQPIIPDEGSELFFKVFRETPYSKLKVIVLGQDPYHGSGQYDGLAFSNSTLDSPQPSLRNILNEVERDVYAGLNLDRVTDYSLYNWAKQGVLLINTALSVRVGQAGSHLHIWRPFTEFVIRELQYKNDLIWLLWGKHAESYQHLITNPSHYKIISGHPSPLNTTTPFKGCGCFSKCNIELEARNKEKIIW